MKPVASKNLLHIGAVRAEGGFTTDSTWHRPRREPTVRRIKLSLNTDFYAEYWGATARDVGWAYGVVESGARGGRRGWVSGDLHATGYRH
ncbi:hypothetical protein ACIPWE_33400 [Streptomyces sp. NPDC090073]|uniref:hypothetical protein n=1 Tax=Streptomyces sp. NPDC090073 TaxID=3365936 RepID=UPI003821F9DC